jgi:hypothetical protein
MIMYLYFHCIKMICCHICVMLLALVCLSTPAQSADVTGVNLKEAADAILTLMGFSLTPDVTTGSLAISNAPTDNPDIRMTTIGGGTTFSNESPLYLEGTAGVSQYDPVFLVTDGVQTREVSTKWRSYALTGGVGWDFPLTDTWTFRPVANISLGRVETDGSLVGFALEGLTGEDIEFLNGGKLKALGLGGALMLDYERYLADSEIDLELRYNNIYLQSIADSSAAVNGNTSAQSVSAWARLRRPTGMVMLNRPLRYVLEAARTAYLGDLRGVLGFDELNSIGIGLELDSTAHDIIVTRTRLVVRYQFGTNIEGTSIGLAVSF